ncbi:MAG TPA: bifunctional DNA primase/polymerase [Stellaceae bacterium]|nr:bifunctional DNA primase/polymerase [Stellaceae bacterium]
MSRLGHAAISYAENFGWPVFPLHTPAANSRARCSCNRDSCTDIGKHPRTLHGLRDATKDSALIHRWWEMWPDANVGVLTGEGSNTLVLDVDPRHGGEESLAALVQRHGALPETVISRTGGGGQHLLFKHVAGIGNSVGRLGPGLDVRGDGGYIVAAPSIHESGRPYAWDVDHHPDDRPVADAPAWLIEQLRERPRNGVAELPETWRRLVAEGVGEGKRNDAIARLSGHLLRRDVDPYVALDLVRCWNAVRCRPPLPEDELVRTFHSIAHRELQRRNHEGEDGR